MLSKATMPPQRRNDGAIAFSSLCCSSVDDTMCAISRHAEHFGRQMGNGGTTNEVFGFDGHAELLLLRPAIHCNDPHPRAFAYSMARCPSHTLCAWQCDPLTWLACDRLHATQDITSPEIVGPVFSLSYIQELD